jgi:chromosome segregation ATPase
MVEIDQQKYGFLFAERLEKTLHEYVRKTIDAEVKFYSIVEIVEEEKRKYNELQNHVQMQNDIISKSTKSIEALTIQNDNTKNNSDSYVSRIKDLESNLNKVSQDNKILNELNQKKELRIQELEREMSRLNQELQITFDDLQNLKNSIPVETKKIINKPKKPVIENIEEGTF